MSADAYGAPVPSGYPVQLSVEYPESQSRAKMFFRALLVIPAVLVLYFVAIAGSVVVVIGWFAVVFTGRYPRGMFDFVVGYLRWATRVNAYYFGLTDEYPPFRMAP